MEQQLLENFKKLDIQKRIFVIGGVASSKSTLIENFKQHLPNFQVIDSGMLFRCVSYLFYNLKQEITNFIKNNETVLLSNNQIQKHINNQINSNLQLLKKSFNNVDYTIDGLIKIKNKGKKCIVINNLLQNELYGKLASIISKNNNIRNLIMSFIYKNIGNNCIMTGHSLKEIDTTKFSIVLLNITLNESIKRLAKRAKINFETAKKELLARNQNDLLFNITNIIKDIYRPIIINVDNMDKNAVFYNTLESLFDYYKHIKCLQILNNKVQNQMNNSITNQLLIKRKDFKWINNYYITTIKKYCNQKIKIEQLNNINKFDFLIRTLIDVSKYNPKELFSLSDDEIAKINYALEHRSVLKEELEKKLENLNILNDHIINICMEKVKQQLDIFYSAEKYIKINKELTKLKEIFNNSIEYTIVLDKKIYKEKYTNKLITFKQIDKDESRLYSCYMHYLHTYREDEMVSFGAYLEGIKYPIAFVSFSKHDRNYKKELLFTYSIESQNTLEMTRAWNHDLAPKNTMSLLFKYAFQSLKSMWHSLKEVGLVNNELTGITTTINPNLGFCGSSFLGSNFKVFALRPAKFTYFKNEDGDSIYMTRRQMQKRLGNNIDITKSDRYSESKLFQLPLNEMIMCFEKSKKELISRSDIKLIKEETYQQI